jgi:alpha-2-macroglobulin
MMHRTKRINRWLSIGLLLALLAGACAPQTPAPTAPPPTQTAVAEPTAPPPPTATPLPLPAPRLLSRSPAPGEAQPPDSPLELTFDQPMDRPSVEAGLSISPAVRGSFSWTGERTLRFTPAEPLERGAGYEVTVAATARNVEGLPLAEEVRFALTTLGSLAVTQVMPAPDSEDLDPDMVVTVVFDRPVVPLAAISQQAALPQPLTFVPPVRGQGEWLNTAIYLFRPDGGFLPATQYKARVAAGLRDTLGGALAEDYTWEFSTLRPAVLQVSPSNGFRYVGPTDVISVTFNQPMDHASVEKSFSLEVEGSPLAGSFRWSGGDKPTAPETMAFIPAEALPRNAQGTAQVASGARAAVGNAGLARAETWRFSTVQEPAVLSVSPPDGATGVSPGGSVQISFASPMQRQGFLEHLTIKPQVTEVYTYWTEYDTQVLISFEREPATPYSLLLDAATPDRHGATLGEASRIRFTTGDLSPVALLNTTGQLGSFSAYTETVIYASHRNVSRLELGLYRLSPETFMALNSDWSAWDAYRPSEENLVRQWTRRLQAPRNRLQLAGFDLLGEGDKALEPGLYYLELTAPEVREANPYYQPSRYMFVKSRLHLSLKQTRSEALVWATDLASGQPVPGLPVGFYARNKRLEQAGRTGAGGLYTADDLPINNLWDAFFAVIGQPGDPDFGIAYNGWDGGIGPWNFDIESEFWASRYQAYLYTDRPIYRPGQTVYFKGIVRGDDDSRYRLPEEIGSVQVQISDPQGKQLYKDKLPLSAMGTLYNELLLSPEAPLGFYYVEIQDPAHELYTGTSFQVAEYRAPDFQVTVETDRDAYLHGDTIRVSAEASYYFGGAVAGADVRWSVLSDDYWFSYRCPQGQTCPWYSWADYEWGSFDDQPQYGGYGRLIAEGDAETDSQGRVTFRVPADLSTVTRSQRFTLEVSVTDVNGQQVSNRTATLVHRGQFYVGVAPRGYLAEVGEEKEVDLLTVDWEGQPTAGVALSVVFMEHRWFSVREQAEDGYYYWTWTAEDTPVLTTTVTTGQDGRAVAAFAPPKAGSYRVRATGRDADENEVRSSAYFWVWGGDFVSWRQESNNRIELIADKEEYQVGDVAEILVPSPYTGTVQALVSLERGHLMAAEVRTLESNSEVIRVPIAEAHVPNLFLSVLIVQGSDQAPDGLASFKMGVVKLPVSVDSKTLAIALTPDKEMAAGERYAPRQTATYDLLVTDHAGRPVEAELSLRLADLAVLALADEPGPSLLETFWRGRGLGVKTSSSLVVSMEQFNRELAPRAKGGGGGEAGLIRSRFADTAFWDPVVRTGADGRAQVQVTLPDNLTTWRMQARGITADTLVGQAEVDIVSSLELLVRPVLPRFFVVGDEAEIAAVVHNNTARELEVKVQITAAGLALQGEAAHTVRVAAGDRVRVPWPVTVLPGEEVTVRIWASAEAPAAGGQDLFDGREDTLPVYRYSTPEVVATAGQLSEPGLRQEIIQLPGTYDPTQGELTVQIDGSLTAATQDALAYLEHYPYECVEQTVSRFLPNVLTWQALEEMGLERPELRQKLAQMVGVGLQRLYNQQQYNGGWGWWTSDKSDPYLTAYVLQGMVEAHRAGFVVDANVMERAAAYLSANLPSVAGVNSHWQANRLAYQLFVLADYAHRSGAAGSQAGTRELGLAVRLFDKRHLLDHYGRATLAVALGLLEPDEPSRVRTLLSDLSGAAIVSATGVHWEEDKPDYRNMNTDLRTTAIVLWAMSGLEPENALLPNTARWLMAMRREGHWETTQNTAWALLGLVGYMRASGELHGDYHYAVYLQGELWAEGLVTPETIDESRRLQAEIGRLLVDEANRLVIERLAPQAGQSGEGRLYYSASLRYFLPAEQVQALDRGILIARQYSPVGRPGTWVDSAAVGDVIQVKLTLIAPTDLYYVVVEDPLPAGFEGVDLGLKTTSVVGEPPTLRNLTAEEQDRWYRRYGWGWWWFSHSEMRDEKAVLFAQYLPRGTYEYTYLMRAGVPGAFLTMPATAYQMYVPEVFGRSDGGKFTVRPAPGD